MNEEVTISSDIIEENKRLKRRIAELERQAKSNKDNPCSESEYKLLVERVPVGIYRTTPDGQIVMANEAFVHMLGYNSFYELTKHKLGTEEIGVDFDRRHYLRKIDEKGELIGFEFELTQKDGKKKFIRETARAVKDSSGNTVYYEGIVEDITEEKISRQIIKDKEERLRRFMDTANDAIFIAEADTGEIIEANKKAEEILGKPLDEIIGMKQTELHPPEFAEKYIDKFAQHIKSKKAVEDGLFARHSSGKDIPVSVSASVFEFKGKTLVQGVFRDITEQKRIENALKESEERFKTLSNVAEEGILIHDDGIILDANDALLNMFGYAREEAIGASAFDYIHPDFVEQVRDLVLNDYDKPYEIVGVRKNGEEVYCQLIGKPLAYKGKMRRVAVVRDITELKLAQRELKIMNEQLEDRVAERTSQLEETLEELRFENEERRRTQEELYKAKEKLVRALEREIELSELKSRFITMVSHEYRTPLTVILSSTYILDRLYEMRSKAEFDAHVSRIQDSVKTMTKLLDDVIAIGKTEKVGVDYEIDEYNIIGLIREIIDQQKVMDDYNHEFAFNYPSNEIIIQTDDKLVHNIVINLLSNAIKFSPKNKTITVSVSDSDKELCVSVEDEGIGIPPDETERMFEPFHRFSNVGNSPGAGLGLAITKKFVDVLKGRITCESKLGVGTTFRVYLPK